jgi:hypothetical protein
MFLRFTNLLITFGTRKNCIIIGGNLLLFNFTRRTIKLTIVIVVEFHFRYWKTNGNAVRQYISYL